MYMFVYEYHLRQSLMVLKIDNNIFYVCTSSSFWEASAHYYILESGKFSTLRASSPRVFWGSILSNLDIVQRHVIGTLKASSSWGRHLSLKNRHTHNYFSCDLVSGFITAARFLTCLDAHCPSSFRFPPSGKLI